MKLFRTSSGIVAQSDGKTVQLSASSWDDLFTAPTPAALLDNAPPATLHSHAILAPIGTQEVWAAGVTYYRSRNARMEESKSAGGGDFYDRVYDAPRPELFFKATPHRVVGPDSPVAFRSDARWSVPEPELALAVNSSGRIIGYTIGNDMSSRDIEGENPLYLPQAKVYDRSCALGQPAFADSTTLASMKRRPQELVDYLFRDNSFPTGCYLLTGTGIVPPDTFTLAPGDVIRIAIDGIGVLVNPVG